MKDRRETAEMPGLLDARRTEEPTRTVQYVEDRRSENAKQGGQIRGRSRYFSRVEEGRGD